jgi:translation initiation factor 4E
MHDLETPWTFYYQRSVEGESWSDSIHKIGSFSTCEAFWSLYSHLLRPDQLDPSISFHVFRNESRAVWEDEENRDGGYFQVRAESPDVAALWERTLLNLIGEQFPPHVCGAVVSLRRGQHWIQLWHRAVPDETNRREICLDFVRCLGIPLGTRKFIVTYQMFSGGRNQSRYLVDQNGVEKERDQRRRK